MPCDVLDPWLVLGGIGLVAWASYVVRTLRRGSRWRPAAWGVLALAVAATLLLLRASTSGCQPTGIPPPRFPAVTRPTL